MLTNIARRVRLVAAAAAAILLVAAVPASADHAAPTKSPAQWQARYAGYVIVEADVFSERAARAALDLGEPLACRIKPGSQPVLIKRDRLKELVAAGVSHRVVVENVGSLVSQALTPVPRLRNAQRNADPFFDTFRRTPDNHAYLTTLTNLRPDITERLVIGQSVQGRDIVGLKISAQGPGSPPQGDKPVLVVNGCQHAREWASPAAVTFVADQLIRTFGSDPRVTELVEQVEFHILPIINPDGYEYTFTNDRFWRKNRAPTPNTVGVDLNRNWPVGFGGASTGSEFSEVYPGPAPFSEPETTALSGHMTALAGAIGCGHPECGLGQKASRVKAHLDVHSFDQSILGPWSFDGSIIPPREQELRLAHTAMSDAMLDATGTFYIAGLGPEQILGDAGGVAPDWSFGELGALAWTVELRPQTSAQGGFVLPADEIVPAGQELFAAVLALADRVLLTVEFANVSVPAIVEADSPADVTADILAFNASTIDTASTALRYRTSPDGPFLTAPLALATGDTYAATLPGFPCGTTVELYLEAQATTGGPITFPELGPDQPIARTVSEALLVADDTLESDTGWVVDPDNTDTATTGVWERADPVGTFSGATPVQPEDDTTPAGVNCFVTGASGGSAGANDVDSGVTTLVSPAFDTAGATDVIVAYNRWYSNNAGASPNADTFTVDISVDNGPWINAQTIGPAGPGTSGGWVADSFTVAALTSPGDTLRLRFTAQDAAGASLVEAAIDDVRVDAVIPCSPPAACPGDANGDLVVDLDDFSLLAIGFGQTVVPGSGADFDGSGNIGLDDFSVLAVNFGNLYDDACTPL